MTGESCILEVLVISLGPRFIKQVSRCEPPTTALSSPPPPQGFGWPQLSTRRILGGPKFLEVHYLRSKSTMIQSLNTTSSEHANDSVRCWIVQHIADSFRKESRNVGVIVQRDGAFDARFVGESSELEFDDRKLRFLEHPKVYRNWVRYWRRLIRDTERAVDSELSSDQDGNFRVIEGGAINRVGADSIESICEYAFAMLVSHGGLGEALHATELGEEPHVVLRDSIAREFRSIGLMGGS